MSNVVTIEELRLKHAVKEQPIQQGVKKVSVDDGFTAIPNELLFAMGQFGFTQRQYAVLIAVIQKTLSWRKEMDWICNEQLADLANLYDHKLASKVKNELIEMNVLIQKGKKIGLNLIVSEWKHKDSTNHTKIVQNVRKKSDDSYYPNRTNHTTTKETNTKEKINTPLTPQGENLPDGKSKVRRRVAEKINFDEIAELWNGENENQGSPLPFVEKINDERKRKIKKFLGELKEPTVDCAEKYFRAFFSSMKPHHLGENSRGWKANFDFAIRADIVLRVREGAL